MKKEYKKGELTVIWNPELCIHSGNCVKNLPGVFKPKEKPWVQLDNAQEKEIIDAVNNCPSGALSLLEQMTDRPVEKMNIIVVDNGPILIKGDCVLDYRGSKSHQENANLALCRCGFSENKPFCDGAHRRNNFRG